jgi:hypothetical protein
MMKRAMVTVMVALTAFAACDRSTPKEEPKNSKVATDSDEPRSLRFVHRAVEVGQRWKTKRESELHVSVEFWAVSERWGAVESHRIEHIEVEDEVLARVGSWPGKLRATYTTHHTREDHPDRGKSESRVLEGRAFVLDNVDGEPTASAADGRELGEEETQNLWVHHPRLGKEDPLIVELSRRPLPVGTAFRMSGQIFDALMGKTEGEFKGGQIRIASVDSSKGSGVALLEWSAKMQTKEQNQMVTDWEIEGTTEVEVDPARLVSQKMQASLTVSGQTRKDGKILRMDGDGTMRDHRRVTYP